MALNQDYQLTNLGNGVYGAYNATTQMGRSFTSQTEARTFFDTPTINFGSAKAASFDTSKLLGTNADKLISFAPPPATNNDPASTGDLKTGSTTGPNLPVVTAPTVTTSYTESLTADLAAKNKALQDSYDKQIADNEAKQKELQTKIDDFNTTQKGIIETNVKPLETPFRADYEATQREKLYVNQNFEANQKLTDELGTLLTEGNTLIQQQKDETGLASIRNPRINQTISDVAARAGVIQAVLAARNGQIAQAYTMIDRSVAATTADRQDQLNYYDTLYKFYGNQKDTAGNALISLKNDEKTFINNKIAVLKSNLDDAKASADKIKELMVSPETANDMAQAGITLNDSVPVINKKLADYTVKKAADAQAKTDRSNALAAGITSQFFNDGGVIKRLADGYAFTSEKDFLSKTGLTVAEATAKRLISNYSAKVDLNSTPDLKEYNVAVSQGYKGTFLEWQKANANLKNHTTVDTPSTLLKEYNFYVAEARKKGQEPLDLLGYQAAVAKAKSDSTPLF